jgi:hypothetical protein
MIDSIVRLLQPISEPWAELYNHSRLVQTSVMFAHLGGLLVSGGFALYMDIRTLRKRSSPQNVQRAHLDEMHSAHPPILIGLVIVMLSGVLLFLTDVDTYAEEPVFWFKLGLVAVLLANGAGLTSAEKAARATRIGSLIAGRLTSHAVVSAVCWMTIVLAGVTLVNA